MSNEDLQDLCRKWQRTLRLQDWFVTVSYARFRELTDGAQANVAINFEKRAAQIRIMEPSDYPTTDIIAPQDIEQALVHELLHLHFASFDDKISEFERTAEEQVLNALAAAFVGREVS